jgi:hypothetical protein
MGDLLYEFRPRNPGCQNCGANQYESIGYKSLNTRIDREIVQCTVCGARYATQSDEGTDFPDRESCYLLEPDGEGERLYAKRRWLVFGQWKKVPIVPPDEKDLHKRCSDK